MTPREREGGREREIERESKSSRDSSLVIADCGLQKQLLICFKEGSGRDERIKEKSAQKLQ